MKKRVLIATFFIAFFSASVIGIRAYFTGMDFLIRRNAIGECGVVVIQEEGRSPSEFSPGDTVERTVRVKNTGTVSCYVRIRVMPTNSGVGWFVNSTDWVSDNRLTDYCYYTEKLGVGETTEPLEISMSISSDISEPELSGADILIYSEAVQAEGFTNYTSTWESYDFNRPD